MENEEGGLQIKTWRLDAAQEDIEDSLKLNGEWDTHTWTHLVRNLVEEIDYFKQGSKESVRRYIELIGVAIVYVSQTWDTVRGYELRSIVQSDLAHWRHARGECAEARATP